MLPEIRFYFLGYLKKKCGSKAYSSYCKECNCNRIYKRKSDKPYKPHTGKRKEDIREEISIDHSTLYLLLKKIEINNLKIDMVDGFRLASIYVDVYGDDIPDYYTELEQLDIMFFRLKEYMNTNQEETT